MREPRAFRDYVEAWGIAAKAKRASDVATVAASLGIKLTAHAVVVERVAAVVAHVDAVLRQANGTGGLKAFSAVAPAP